MASTKILFLNSFWNKKKNNKKGSNYYNNNKKKDDLDLVKAAAWAWYEHGSGSERNNKGLMNEFDITTTRTTHQRTSTRPPSRYKLEAMKRMELNNDHHREEEGVEEYNIKSHRKKRNSLLFDAYEVQSISRQIDTHIIIESNNKNKNNTTSSSSSSSLMMKKNKKEKTKGFWLRHGVVCGRGEDVVDLATSAIRGGGRRRQKASRVPDLGGTGNEAGDQYSYQSHTHATTPFRMGQSPRALIRTDPPRLASPRLMAD
ncbi:hypothetical protein PIB30_084354 [Stylosanthes scabra]|uniref:Uncharacterized protein n=1 Tax=Stylosanthes scabra TaxID=79078 RepID=A0ABU6WQU2_9FABA|nr:hypothetical protein [Stylosanthes scabra]